MPRHLATSFILAVALALPLTAFALPRESAVPGGIALVRLGTAVPGAATPRAWLGEQPVWVSAEGGQWTAVVGLALDLPPGSHQLRVVGLKRVRIGKVLLGDLPLGQWRFLSGDESF